MNTTEFYDLFVTKMVFSSDAFFVAGLPLKLGAMGLDIDIQTAHEFKEAISSDGGKAVVFPSVYRTPKYSYKSGFAIALAAYQSLVVESPSNYGPLELYSENPVYWLFSADNYALQAEGYSPGRNAFPIDKLTGEVLSESDLKTHFHSLQG